MGTAAVSTVAKTVLTGAVLLLDPFFAVAFLRAMMAFFAAEECAQILAAPVYAATKLARSPQFGENSNSGWSCWTLSATLRKACADAEKPVGGETERLPAMRYPI